jgi:hypothetical protein
MKGLEWWWTDEQVWSWRCLCLAGIAGELDGQAERSSDHVIL